MTEQLTGTVKWFDARKGYGFITPDDASDEDQNDIFVHFRDAPACGSCGHRELREGQPVTFTIGEGKDGRTKAENVALVDA